MLVWKNSEAQRLLGHLLSRDPDDPSGQVRAVELFRSAAEAGDGYAALNLSRATPTAVLLLSTPSGPLSGRGWPSLPDWSKRTATSFLTLLWAKRMGDALHAAYEIVARISQTDVYRAGSPADHSTPSASGRPPSNTAPWAVLPTPPYVDRHRRCPAYAATGHP